MYVYVCMYIHVYMCGGVPSSLSVTVLFIRTHLFDWNCNLLQPFIRHTWSNIHTYICICTFIHTYVL